MTHSIAHQVQTIDRSAPSAKRSAEVYFKAVHDQLGHPVGERVLKHIAETLTRQVRADNAVIRWGARRVPDVAFRR